MNEVLSLVPSPPPEDAWQAALARSGSGKPRKEAGNVALTFCYEKAWKNAVKYDAFADRVICDKFPPLPDLSSQRPSLEPPLPGDITEQHDVYASLWLARKWEVSWPSGAVRGGLVYAARQRSFHPLQDYLHHCHAAWDRTPRLDTWMADHLGVVDNDYSRSVASMFLLSAVARALEPGCKVDHVLVLEGPQGKGKTTALEIMFGKDWFLPDLPDLRDKDAMHLLAGCWCALADELSAIRGAASVERAKSFFTRTIDVYRPPYGKDAVRRPRTTVFAATTNAPEYLTDETGNRRYWSVTAQGALDFGALRAARDQIWGEAIHRYLSGEHWWPEGDAVAGFRAEADKRVVSDEWEAMLAGFVAGKPYVTIGDCLQHVIPDDTTYRLEDQRRAARCLSRLGLEQHRPWVADAAGVRRRVRRYYAPGQWVASSDGDE
jgi:predicted P-loop ATPase